MTAYAAAIFYALALAAMAASWARLNARTHRQEGEDR